MKNLTMLLLTLLAVTALSPLQLRVSLKPHSTRTRMESLTPYRNTLTLTVSLRLPVLALRVPSFIPRMTGSPVTKFNLPVMNFIAPGTRIRQILKS